MIDRTGRERDTEKRSKNVGGGTPWFLAGGDPLEPRALHLEQPLGLAGPPLRSALFPWNAMSSAPPLPPPCFPHPPIAFSDWIAPLVLRGIRSLFFVSSSRFQSRVYSFPSSSFDPFLPIPFLGSARRRLDARSNTKPSSHLRGLRIPVPCPPLRLVSPGAAQPPGFSFSSH
jgi:hypothetical protein